jgi:hypothetical protein
MLAKKFPKMMTAMMMNNLIPAVTSEQQKPVEKLVERILAAKAKAADADVRQLERELDELVYALYALTPAEIKIVEGTAK